MSRHGWLPSFFLTYILIACLHFEVGEQLHLGGVCVCGGMSCAVLHRMVCGESAAQPHTPVALPPSVL